MFSEYACFTVLSHSIMINYFAYHHVLTFHILSAELGGVLEAMGVKTSKQKLAKMIKEVDTGG